MILYEYVRWVEDLRPREARDTFNHWRRTLQKVERVLLDEKINALRTAATVDDLPGLVAGPIKEKGVKYPHILKLQIGGKFRLRPLLCRGPFEDGPGAGEKVSRAPAEPGDEPNPPASMDTDLTLLLGAREIQSRITPSPGVAVERREIVLKDPDRSRRYKAEPWKTPSKTS